MVGGPESSFDLAKPYLEKYVQSFSFPYRNTVRVSDTPISLSLFFIFKFPSVGFLITPSKIDHLFPGVSRAIIQTLISILGPSSSLLRFCSVLEGWERLSSIVAIPVRV